MNVFKFGFKYFKKYLPQFIFGVSIYQILTLCGLTFPLFSKLIFDYILVENVAPVENAGMLSFLVDGRFGDAKTINLFLTIVLAFTVLFTIRHICHLTYEHIMHKNGEALQLDFRRITMNKLLNQNSIVLNRYNSGDLVTIMHSDTIVFKDLYMFNISNIINTVLLLVLSFVFLFSTNAMLSIAPIVMIPIFVFIASKYVKMSKRVNTTIRNRASELALTVQENITAVRVVRSFASEEYEMQKFQTRNNNMRDSYFTHAKETSRYRIYFDVIRWVTYVASILVGAVLAFKSKISIGDFVAFTSYVFIIMDAIVNLVNHLFTTQQLLVSGGRIQTFCETGDIIKNIENPISLDKVEQINFNNYSLTLDNVKMLKNINLTIHKGDKIGIMGKTGSGKTALIKAMNRFYDPIDGFITMNGNDIRNIDLEDIRHQFSYVMQDVFLFSETIEANIAYYDKDPDLEKVEKVSKIALAHDFILKTSDGYKTIVGERGTGLSGGQKQRISIARALYKNAPVLVFDDATSALDNETELMLMKNIEDNYKDLTMILSTHRVSSLKYCNLICYMENGEILERGTHLELLKLNGKYAESYYSQQAEMEENKNG